MRGRVSPALLLTGALVLGACGGQAAPEADDTGAQPVASVEDVETAVVRIVANGSFVEPGDSLATYEEVSGAGSGSGFIVDPEGIAVTNNHVVTGAATFDVYVGGSDEPVNAKVLGVSECNDLAVIDLEGSGYPFLAWDDSDIKAGREVRAAGHPLGDPEYTLTSGIVSKAEANGDTAWASVDQVIEHDANIQPGNSGGPLVDAETGAVLGVNYASGDPGTGTSQFFAIPSSLAAPVVEQLREGDVDSLGVNGRAVIDEESGIQGIWVSSVDTNSPAGELSLQGGDIIEKIEGLAMGSDGTMADYCKVLASHDPGDKLAVQVLRFAEDARLRGQFNGDELSTFESLGQEAQQQVGELPAGTPYTEYVSISDDSGKIRVEVPVEWSDVDGSPLVLDDGTSVASVSAAPDLAAFGELWDVPGMTMQAYEFDVGSDLDGILDTVGESATANCSDSERQDYDDGLYVGRYQYFAGCGEQGGGAVVLIVAQPPGQEFTVVALVQLASEADFDALDKIISTFIVEV